MIFLDMDGVICNIGQAVADLYNIEVTPEEEKLFGNALDKLINLETKQELWNIINAIPDFWENIPPYPWCEELVDALQSVDEVQILTSSPSTDALTKSNASTGKSKWVGKHLLDKNLRVNIVHDKYLLAAPERILIDDRESHCNLFRQYGGKSILFKQPWNQGPYNARAIITFARRIKQSNNIISLFEYVEKMELQP